MSSTFPALLSTYPPAHPRAAYHTPQSFSRSPSLVHSESSDTSLDWSKTDSPPSLRGPSRPPSLAYAIPPQPQSTKGQYWLDPAATYQSAQTAQQYLQDSSGVSYPPGFAIADSDGIAVPVQSLGSVDYGSYEPAGVMDSTTMAGAFERPDYVATHAPPSMPQPEVGDDSGVLMQQPSWQWAQLNQSPVGFVGNEQPPQQMAGQSMAPSPSYSHPESSLRGSISQPVDQMRKPIRPLMERRRTRQSGQQLITAPHIKLERTDTDACGDVLYNPQLDRPTGQRPNFAPQSAPNLSQNLHLQTQLQSRDPSRFLPQSQANYSPVTTYVQQAQAARDRSPLNGPPSGTRSALPLSQRPPFATPLTPFSAALTPNLAPATGLPSYSSSFYPQREHHTQRQSFSNSRQSISTPVTMPRQSVSPKEVELDESQLRSVEDEGTLFSPRGSTQIPSTTSNPIPLETMASNASIGGIFGGPSDFDQVENVLNSTSVTTSNEGSYNFVPAPSASNFRPNPFSAAGQTYHTLPSSMPSSMMPPPIAREPSPGNFVPTLTTMESTMSDRAEIQLLHPSQDSDSYTPNVHLLKPHPSNADTGTYTCTYHGCDLRFETPRALQKHKREGHRARGNHMRSTPHTVRNAAHLSSNSTAASANGSGESRSASPVEGTQSGPHNCNRLNPQTGKPCNASFSRPYDLTRHEDTIHNRKKLKIRCNYCSDVEKLFSRRDALTRHLRIVHPEMADHENRRKKQLLNGE